MPKLLKFDAWIDRMPGAGNALHVHGFVEVPTTGWSGTLEKVVPQGINPAILLLEARLVAPAAGGTVVSTIEVDFHETPAAEQYVEVDIRLDGEAISVPVTITN